MKRHDCFSQSVPAARRAFTLIELMIVLVVAAIIAVGVIPDQASQLAHEVDSASRQFESDVSYARSLSIAQPDDPAAIKFEAPKNRYWLARKSNVDAPIAHPRTKKPYVVTVGTEGGGQTKNVSIVGLDTGGDSVILFDGTGNLVGAAPAIVQFSAGNAVSETKVSPDGARAYTAPTLSTDLSTNTEMVAPLEGEAVDPNSNEVMPK